MERNKLSFTEVTDELIKGTEESLRNTVLKLMDKKSFKNAVTEWSQDNPHFMMVPKMIMILALKKEADKYGDWKKSPEDSNNMPEL